MSFKFVWRNLMAHKWRTLLTAASVTLAVFLLCVLRAAVTTLETTVQAASNQRLWVQSAVSLFVDLPLSYESKIAAVDGVERVCKFQWFGGEYPQDDKNFFAQFGVDPETMLDCYPELRIVKGDYQAFRRNRTGCIIGKDLFDRYGWEIGTKVPIRGRIFPRNDGSSWEFQVEAVYESTSPNIDQNTLYFDFEYLEESIEGGAVSGDAAVGVYLVYKRPSADSATVQSDIDTLFQNGPQVVQTTTDAAFSKQFISMLGSVPTLLQSVGGAVLFAIFFAVLNTMLMAGRERTRDIGILKALGFRDGAVFQTLLAESMLLCGLGGGLGLALAKLAEAGLQGTVGAIIQGFSISGDSMLVGAAITVAIGLIAGIGPGWRAMRLSPVLALRNED